MKMYKPHFKKVTFQKLKYVKPIINLYKTNVSYNVLQIVSNVL